MDLVVPELPKNVISSISSTMANLYRIIPISKRGAVLTVAASQAVAQSELDIVLDELNAFLGFKMQSVRVADCEIDRALHHYYADPPDVVPKDCIHLYPHPEYARQSELRQLLTRVMEALGQSDVKHVSICRTLEELVVITRRHTGGDSMERFQDGEFGQRLFDRLKLMANIDISDHSAQRVVIEASFRSVKIWILSQFSVQDDMQLVELSGCGEPKEGSGAPS